MPAAGGEAPPRLGRVTPPYLPGFSPIPLLAAGNPNLHQFFRPFDRQAAQPHSIQQLKIAVFAPIPSASDNTATVVNAGLKRSSRAPYRKSCQMLSNRFMLFMR
jgi:hypothetical protein